MHHDAVKVQRRTSGSAVIPMGARGQLIRRQRALDLVHITAAGAARDIVRDGEISAKECKVFARDLAYFFVGRAVYRLRNGRDKSEYVSKFPVAFVVDSTHLGTPFHVYPLDTGALMNGLFGAHPDPYVYLEDYELSPNLEEIRRHIQWAFGDNEKYLEGKLKPDLIDGLPHYDEVGRAFLSLARLGSARSSNRPDFRASSIEIAYDRRIPLAGNIRFAVFPKQYLESGGHGRSPLVHDLSRLQFPWEIYNWHPNRRPDDYADEILTKVNRFLQAGSGS